MSHAASRFRLQPLRAVERLLPLGERFEEGLRPLEGRAVEVKPVCRLAVGERVGQPLSKAHLESGDLPVAPPALRTTGRGRLDDVWHDSLAIQVQRPLDNSPPKGHDHLNRPKSQMRDRSGSGCRPFPGLSSSPAKPTHS